MENTSRHHNTGKRLSKDRLDPEFIPKNITQLLTTLENHDHSAYIVGGCVRDWFLGYDLSEFLTNGGDFDITTSATVDEMKDIFHNYKQILDGEEFGTLKLYDKGEIIEITTFRIERAYRDGRHPEEVVFSDQVEDDLSRRDFTINAMAADSSGKVIDPFDGRADLEQKLVRTVGVPEERFGEDYLRMLRAVRFATSLDFTIHELTFQAIKKIQKSNIDFSSAVSSERKLSELQKILGSQPHKGFQLLVQTGLISEVLPFVDPSATDQVNRLASILRYPSPDWMISLVIIIKEVEQNGISTSPGEIDTYLTSLACPIIDKNHILNLLDQFPLPEEIWTSSCSEINSLKIIWDCVSMYKKDANHENRFWVDLFKLYDILVTDELSEDRKSEIVNLWEYFPRSSDIEIFLDGNEIIELGYQGRAISLVIEELRYYRPKNREDAFVFAEQLPRFPLDLSFVSEQINSLPGELVTKEVKQRRAYLNEIISQH